MAVRAIAFDFNGTLSHDEPILYSVYRDLFAERGRPLSEEDYFGRLAGHTEETIIRTWLGVEGDELRDLVQERIERYLDRAAGGHTVPGAVREAVAAASAQVPVAVVSGAFRREIEPVLAGAGLSTHVSFLVTADDVLHGKPDPECYRRAVELLGEKLEAADVVAIEDTEAGVAAAKGAGVYCVGVLGTHTRDRLAAADELVEQVDRALVERLLA